MSAQKSPNKNFVNLSDVRDAEKTIRAYLQPTPLLRNSWLSDLYQCDLYLKLENMQPIGSFKIRGALNKISKLSASEKKKGVIAASAGNHAQGVAWGSKELGVNALIVMPRGASLVKIQNTRALGAEVVLEGDNYDQAYAYALKLAKKTGRIFVHAFDDPEVIAGQGTMGLEILEQLPDVDFVVGSIGGGGMMAGISLVLKELRPQTQIVGCQATGASTMIRSLRSGKLIHHGTADTFADGIAVKEPSPRMYQFLSSRIDYKLEADDESIAAAVLMLLEKAKIVVEGACAVSLAVLEKIQPKIRGKKVVLMMSGGNIDVNLISRIIDRGLIRSGRRLRINALLHDRPGSLARLTEMIAHEGANILQAIHDRNEPWTRIDQTDVALTLETRGPEHSDAIIDAMKKQVLRLDVVE